MVPGPTSPAAPTRRGVVPVPAGLVLAPLRALRYDVTHPAVAGDLAALTSPPYDVINDDEVQRLETTHPHNVVRLILPRDRPGEPGSRYRAAAATLRQWRAAGVLRPDPQPALYVYEEADGDDRQRGLLGALSLAQPEQGVVLPHENTMGGPVADRLALTEATEANLEPIFLVYDGGGVASRVVASIDDAAEATLLAQARTEDGIGHRLWALTDPDLLAQVALDLLPRRAVIADGHHRYATYLRYQADQHAAGAGAGPWDAGLTLLVDATAFGPRVQAIHRVVPTLPVAEAVRRAAGCFTVQRLAGGLDGALTALRQAGQAGTAVVLTGAGEYHLLTAPAPAVLASAVPAGHAAAWRELDVTVVHAVLVRRLWQLDDTEDVVGFEHDPAAAVSAAQASGGTAVLLNPTPVADVVAVAAAGERMPRKSTLFVPKPRTGLVIRAFADQ